MSEERSDFYVYMWTNLVNGRRYIGKGTGTRGERHLVNAFNEKKWPCAPVFYRAIRKYGPTAFSFSFIATNLDDTTALRVERAFIAMYRTLSEGYNCTEGGQGPAHTAETKAKIGRGNSGKKRIFTEEWKRKLGDSNRGKTFDDTHRLRIGNRHRELRGLPPLTPAHRENMRMLHVLGSSYAQLGRWFQCDGKTAWWICKEKCSWSAVP